MADRNLVVGSKPWNRRVFDELIAKLPGEWRFAGSKAELEDALVGDPPRRIFFLHWSWKVPDDLVERCECINFHMADVPFGRGGSPLQNLIERGLEQTRLSALRMTADFDAGPVYDKRPLDLHGTAEEIYVRATRLAASMIETIVQNDTQPAPQTGEVTMFRRRRPEQSEIPELPTLDALHDFIRMLDADGYPRAFLRWQGFRFEFERASLYDGRIVADVRITEERP